VSDDDNSLISARRAKLAQLREQGVAFPNDFRRDALAGQLLSTFADRDATWFELNPVRVHVGGRMMFKRVMGRSSFAVIADRSGQIQLFLQQSARGAVYEAFKDYDIGDLLGAVGLLFRTRTGELSVRVEMLQLLTKSLRPLPDKWHGVADTELRYRQRYVDLIMTERSREVFRTRTHVLRYLRDFLDALDFLEVETPMMQPIPGGAAARPFVTHHNALDVDMYLRIAPELYLKRLIVGGFERVYEINRNFRNEGISTQHNPEFTMLEFYQAYANYHDLMDLTEELIKFVTMEVNGTTKTNFNDVEIDLSKWRRFSMREAIIEFWPEVAGAKPEMSHFASDESVSGLVEQMRSIGSRVEFQPGEPRGKTIATIFETVAEKHLIQPTIIYDFPLAVSPLSKQKPDEPDWVERFEFYIGGFEVGNAFSELNDPAEQRRRFQQQIGERERGDDEAHQMDEDYVRALGYGLPPTGGEGIGIDRLTMILTGAKSIRDVILFPLLRPQKNAGEGEPSQE
jgi:lysyl-tRNA synthetase, class II